VKVDLVVGGFAAGRKGLVRGGRFGWGESGCGGGCWRWRDASGEGVV
jgi:hypothetical protein